MNDEITHNLYTLSGRTPDLIRLDPAMKMRISHGEFRCRIKSLIQRAWSRASVFDNSRTKTTQTCVSPVVGLSEKANIEISKLARKVHEYGKLKIEIPRRHQESSKSLKELMRTWLKLDKMWNPTR